MNRIYRVIWNCTP
ncbi:hypothetical protein JFX92_21620 [Escherichia coli]|nr:hypothetical protein [Escherichia coli]